jgi:hypothetical protein
MAEKDVRQCTIRTLVDSGAYLADGVRQVCRVTEPVKIQWENRDTVCRALLLPGAEEVLLGAIPLEDMDLIVDPAGGLKRAHGDEAVCLVM